MRERQKWLDWRFVSRDGLRGFVRDRHLEKVSVIEIPRRILHLAASCLSVPEGTGQKPAHPAALPSLLDYIWRHSRTVPLCAFNLPPRPSCHIWLLFFAVGCDMKMSTLSGGVCWWCWASHLSPLPSFALCDFSFFFSHSSVAVFSAALLLLCTPLFFYFCRVQISRSPRLTVSCDDTATSDLPLDLRGHCAAVFVCVGGASPLKHVCLFCMWDTQRVCFLSHQSPRRCVSWTCSLSVASWTATLWGKYQLGFDGFCFLFSNLFF